MKRILYIFFQLTWGFIQSLAGFVIFLLNLRREHFSYHGALVTKWSLSSSVSLGLFVFVAENYPAYYKNGKVKYTKEEMQKKLLVHEYGHTIQSLIFGPFYLLFMGLPSCLWAGFPPVVSRRRKRRIPYGNFFTERLADHLGKAVTGEDSLQGIFLG